MGICDKLSRYLSMLTYIYLNMDECRLTFSKGVNSKFVLIMVKFNKIWFPEVCYFVKDCFDVVIANTSLLIP